MDMKISGAGVLGGGEYEDVRINGSAKIEGSICCHSFACAGAAKGEGDLDCMEDFRCAGSTRVDGAIRAGSAYVSGSLHCASLHGEDTLRIAGSAHVEDKLSGGEIMASGRLQVGGDIEAESFQFSDGSCSPVSSGNLDCDGLLNAETVRIHVGARRHRVAAIGGGSVTVDGNLEDRPEGDSVSFGLFGAFKRWNKHPVGGSLTVDESIEADEVTLANTLCPLVSGRRVIVGPGCRIDLVRYSESVEIDPDAQVGRQERI